MERWTRRRFLAGAAQAAAGATVLGNACGPGGTAGAAEAAFGDGRELVVPLDGTWLFRTDPDRRGEAAGWNGADIVDANGWEEVSVPSTWQVAGKTVDYLGSAWYRREFDAPEAWKALVVRIEFEAVFHTAEVFVNGKKAGEHVGKGYTAFALDISGLLAFGGLNAVAVRVDNAFSPDMLPRNDSYDWTPDGGITRPVRLIVTPPVYIERLWVDAVPELPAGPTAADRDGRRSEHDGERGADRAQRMDRGGSFGRYRPKRPCPGRGGRPGGRRARGQDLRPPAGPPAEALAFRPSASLRRQSPDLRRGKVLHRAETTFGVRRIEVRGTEFLLNGEPVRLAGVERMGGSHPDFGMAEPAPWIDHDHADLKELNCVLHPRPLAAGPPGPRLLRPARHPHPGRSADLGAGHVPEARREHPREGHGERPRAAPRDDRPRQEPPVRLLLGPLQRGRRAEPGRPELRPGHAPRGQASRSRRGSAPTPRTRFSRRPSATWPARWTSSSGTSTTRPGSGATSEAMRRNLEAIHRAFPDKPVVISEYGYCACTADRPEDDARRADDPRDPQRRLPGLPLGRRAHLLRLQRLPDAHRRQGTGGPQAAGPRRRRRLRRPQALLRGAAPRSRARSNRSTVRTEGSVRPRSSGRRRTVPAYTLRGLHAPLDGLRERRDPAREGRVAPSRSRSGHGGCGPLCPALAGHSLRPGRSRPADGLLRRCRTRLTGRLPTTDQTVGTVGGTVSSPGCCSIYWM